MKRNIITLHKTDTDNFPGMILYGF